MTRRRKFIAWKSADGWLSDQKPAQRCCQRSGSRDRDTRASSAAVASSIPSSPRRKGPRVRDRVDVQANRTCVGAGRRSCVGECPECQILLGPRLREEDDWMERQRGRVAVDGRAPTLRASAGFLPRSQSRVSSPDLAVRFTVHCSLPCLPSPPPSPPSAR
jgi:hypothetical protein